MTKQQANVKIEALKRKIQKLVGKHEAKASYCLGHGFLWVLATLGDGKLYKFCAGYGALADWGKLEADLKVKFPQVETCWVNLD